MARFFFVIITVVSLMVSPAMLHADYTATVNPNSNIVTNFQGWGTSLCWWANVIGSYPNRTDYVNLAFSTLKLNIVRYNIGGGENPSSPVSGQGYRTIMQGFEPTNGIWNWNADTNQRWVLQQAEARGAGLVDAFANSPPWWMCVNSNCVGNASHTNNLQVNNETNFAIYLATVVSNLTVLDGDHFNYVTPMNEPNGSEWYETSPSQEGCNMDPTQQGRVVSDLYAQLNTMAPSVGIDAAEDVDPYQTYNDLTYYSTAQLGDVALFTTHSYGFTGASSLKSQANSQKKTLWLSEDGDSDATGMTMARYIYNDINVMGARAWIYWQVVDSAGGWGFLLNSLLATTNASYTPNYIINEKFYVMGQFSEFVRPGCNIISVNDTNTLAAWNPTNGTLTLVMVNNTSSSLNVTYNLGDFGSLPWQFSSATQTDPAENMATLSSPTVTSQAFTAAIPASSVTTFVLTTNSAPAILSQAPAKQSVIELYAGEMPAFSVSATGSPPLSYQWFTNYVAVAGATNTVYTPGSIPSNSLTIVYCTVTNAFGSTNTVHWDAETVTAPAAPYPQAVLALHPLDYWPLNEAEEGGGDNGVTAYDYAGGNNGVYSNVVLGQLSYNPAEDPSETAALFGSLTSANSDAGQIQNPDFSAPAGSNAEFSVTAWVNGTGYAQTVNAGIVTKGYFYQEELDLDEGAPGADFRFEVRNAAGAAYNANSAINANTNGGWHFLAGVCDEANGDVSLYVDGVLAGRAAIPALSGITNASSDPISIGARAQNAAGGNNEQFFGLISDVALYNYALTSNQVQTLYQAGALPPAVSLLPSGNNLIINFTGTLLSSTNVAGPYLPVPGASAPTYIVPMTNSQMFYRAGQP